MAQIAGYNPQPGQQQAGRYPFVGPNYQKYGEQPGFVYDPYSDQYYRDPKVQKQIYQQQGLIPEDPKKQGLADLLIPTAVLGGTLIASQELGKEIPGMLGIGKEGGGLLGNIGTNLGLGSGPTTATSSTGAIPAFSYGAPEAAASEYASSALAGGETAAAGSTGMFDLAGIGAEGNVLLPAAGLVGAYDLLTNDREGIRGPLQGAASGAAIGSYFGPQGALIGGGIGLLTGIYKGYFDKPSIREQVKKRWGGLAKSKDSTMQAYAQRYMEYLDSDQAKADAKLDFNEMKKNGLLTPEKVWGGYGMFKTWGADWLNRFTNDQRRDISQQLINEGLLESRKGDIHITDPARAKQIAEDIVAGKLKVPVGKPSAQTPPAQQAPQQRAPAQSQQGKNPVINAVQSQNAPLPAFNTENIKPVQRPTPETIGKQNAIMGMFDQPLPNNNQPVAPRGEPWPNNKPVVVMVNGQRVLIDPEKFRNYGMMGLA